MKPEKKLCKLIDKYMLLLGNNRMNYEEADVWKEILEVIEIINKK